MANSLDQDQARHFVGPDLDPNCLQRLSADDKSPLAGKLVFLPSDKNGLICLKANRKSQKLSFLGQKI